MAFFLVALLVASSVVTAKEELHIASLLPMTGVWPGGTAMLAAADLALEHVNNRTDVLPGYDLRLHYGDSVFKVYEGSKWLHRLLTTPPTKVAVLAAANSELSESSALISELWNLICVSYASVSPVLSDKKTFPRFFRTSAPDTATNPARIAMMKTFGWTKAALFHQSRAVFDAKLDARIIFCIANKDRAMVILCEAYKRGMTSKNYVWIMVGWYDDNWWRTTDPNIDCTLEEMDRAAEGYMAAGDVVLNPSGLAGLAGITPRQFVDLYDERTNYEHPHGSNLVTQAYDAIWAIALALDKTEKDLLNAGVSKNLSHFRYDDIAVADLIFENMKTVSFQGVKSPIVFDSNQDPVIMVKIERVQNGVRDLVGIYHPSGDNGSYIDWSEETPLLWTGGRPPKDATTRVEQDVFASRAVYIACCTVAALGMVLAVGFLVVNIMYRSVRTIKMSSPNINNVILLGCIIMYATVFLQERDTDSVEALCKCRSFSLVIGFALSFGALFSKTWRIHIIFANKKLKRKVVKDGQLMILVGVLLAVDLLVLIIWETADSQYVEKVSLSEEESEDGETVTEYFMYRCESKNKIYFVGTLYAIQGLLLLVGSFLAFETRKVKIAALNDSQHIGMCIYNVVILSIMAVIMSFVLGDQVKLHYGLMSGFIIFGTTLTQCIIFMPKVLKLRESQVGADDESATDTGTGTTGTGTATGTGTGTAIRSSTMKEVEEKLRQALNQLEQKEKVIKELKGEEDQPPVAQS